MEDFLHVLLVFTKNYVASLAFQFHFGDRLATSVEFLVSEVCVGTSRTVTTLSQLSNSIFCGTLDLLEKALSLMVLFIFLYNFLQMSL